MSALVNRVGHAVAWRWRRLLKNSKTQMDDLYRAVRGSKISKELNSVEIDPRISYPCYKSMDEFIDVERLRALEPYLKQKVRTFIQSDESEEFHTGRYKLNIFSRTRPGARMIPLSVLNRPYDYIHLNNPECWEPSEYADDFSELMDFIGTLPFKGTARMIIIADDQGRAVSAHRDHPVTDMKHEFIWFRPSLNDKPFFMFDPRTKEKVYVKSYSAWFDTVNQFHGAESSNDLAISIRVDGVFSDEFRAQIPEPSCNPASTAALWASLSNR